jgi:adenosylhomocysteine nucleosidase
MRPVVVLFALPVEASEFLKKHRPSVNDHGIYEDNIGGVTVCIGISGMKCENILSDIQEIMGDRPSVLIFTGFAGALDDNLVPGDLVIAESVTDARIDPPMHYACDSQLFDLAVETAVNNHLPVAGRSLLCTDMIVQSPDEKMNLKRCYDCAVVDMESGPGAAISNILNVPFIVVRSIVDVQKDVLPASLGNVLKSDGKVSLKRLIIEAFKEPILIIHLIKLGLRSHAASRSLADFLIKYIPNIQKSD